MGGDNNLQSFLLKEYEKIAEAFFDAREVTSKWVKYYLLVAAVPFSFIAFIYKDYPEEFNFACIPDTLAYLFSLIGLIGLFLTFIIVNSGTDSILYARAVNGIRKYYVDLAKKHDFDLLPYIVLPYDVNIPKYINLGGELSLIVFISGLINSIYLGIGFSGISIVHSVYKTVISQTKFTVVIIILSILIHGAYYIKSAKNKEKMYGPKL